jgi:hypothetical protein
MTLALHTYGLIERSHWTIAPDASKIPAPKGRNLH